jgi:hypothetical protein
MHGKKLEKRFFAASSKISKVSTLQSLGDFHEKFL